MGIFLIAVAIGAYLIGSIPFGLLLTKLAGYGDIRTIGSGNIGATNVLRTGNKKLAALTVLLDAGKGAVPVLLLHYFLRNNVIAAIIGIAIILGHMFPVWLKFKGGKGVATSFGVIAALCLPVGLAAFLTWIAAAFITRLSSLSALITAFLAPFYYWLFLEIFSRNCIAPGCGWKILYGWYVLPFMIVISLLVIAKHHANIRRLLNGTEPKMSFGKK